MRRVLAPALIAVSALGVAGPAAAQTVTTTQASPAKKELVQRILRVQQGDIEAMARSLVEQPAARMMQEAGMAMQQMQFPQEKFQATGKQIEAEVKKYIDEALPIVRERALKIAPTTIGAALETKMSEDELKQLLAWLESPVSKKLKEVTSDARSGFSLQVSRETAASVQPKLVALDGRIRVILGVPPASATPSAASASSAKAPAKSPGK